MVYYPSTTVTFEVKDIFVQTPGPGAGEKIAFAPEAQAPALPANMGIPLLDPERR